MVLIETEVDRIYWIAYVYVACPISGVGFLGNIWILWMWCRQPFHPTRFLLMVLASGHNIFMLLNHIFYFTSISIIDDPHMLHALEFISHSILFFVLTGSLFMTVVHYFWMYKFRHRQFFTKKRIIVVLVCVYFWGAAIAVIPNVAKKRDDSTMVYFSLIGMLLPALSQFAMSVMMWYKYRILRKLRVSPGRTPQPSWVLLKGSGTFSRTEAILRKASMSLGFIRQMKTSSRPGEIKTDSTFLMPLRPSVVTQSVSQSSGITMTSDRRQSLVSASKIRRRSTGMVRPSTKRHSITSLGNRRQSIVSRKSKRPSVVSTTSRCPSDVSITSRHHSIISAGKRRSSIVSAGKRRSSIASVGKRRSSILSAGKKRHSIVSVGKKRHSIVSKGRKRSSIDKRPSIEILQTVASPTNRLVPAADMYARHEPSRMRSGSFGHRSSVLSARRQYSLRMQPVRKLSDMLDELRLNKAVTIISFLTFVLCGVSLVGYTCFYVLPHSNPSRSKRFLFRAAYIIGLFFHLAYQAFLFLMLFPLFREPFKLVYSRLCGKFFQRKVSEQLSEKRRAMIESSIYIKPRGQLSSIAVQQVMGHEMEQLSCVPSGSTINESPYEVGTTVEKDDSREGLSTESSGNDESSFYSSTGNTSTIEDSEEQNVSLPPAAPPYHGTQRRPSTPVNYR